MNKVISLLLVSSCLLPFELILIKLIFKIICKTLNLALIYLTAVVYIVLIYKISLGVHSLVIVLSWTLYLFLAPKQLLEYNFTALPNLIVLLTTPAIAAMVDVLKHRSECLAS